MTSCTTTATVMKLYPLMLTLKLEIPGGSRNQIWFILTDIITLWKKTSKIEAPMFDGKAILLWHCVQSHFWASGVIVFCVTSLEMMLSEGISPAFFEMGLSWHDPCWQHFLYSIHQAATVPNIPPPLPPPKHSLFQTAFCLSTLAVRYGIFKNGYLKLLDILVITIKCILSTRN